MRQYLPLITLVCLFLFGSVLAGSAIAGMRRGRYWYKYGWLSKGGDGIFFWVVTITVAIAGFTVAAGVIWLALTHGVLPPER